MSESQQDGQDMRRVDDGGRRYVALLFADLCDSTALGEAIDLEESVALRQQLEDITLQVVGKHGGKVSQIYGDGVLAVFGYPAPLEDDARRAVEAAVELHETIRRTPWSPSLPFDFEVRLHSGVHAGRVFARQGDALHGRYELVGDAVNTAARLEGANKHFGTRLCVSGRVKALMPEFVGRPVGSVVLTGKNEALELYEPLSAELAESSATQDYMEAFEKLDGGDPAASQAFAAYVGVHGEDPLATFHLKRLLAGETSDGPNGTPGDSFVMRIHQASPSWELHPLQATP